MRENGKTGWGRATPVLLSLLLLAPLAAAGGPAPQAEQLVAFAPVVVDGAASATIERDGMVLLGGPGAFDAFEVHGDRLRVTLQRERVECVALAGIEQCAKVAGSEETEVLDLRVATMRAKGEILDEFAGVVTLRSEHLEAHADAEGGTLRLSHPRALAELDVASRTAAAPADDDATAPLPVSEVASASSTFAARGDDFAYTVREGEIAVEGRFGTFLSGVAVHLQGTDMDGDRVDRVILTGRSASPAPYGRSETVELLYAEAADAQLDARYRGDVALLGRPLVRAQEALRVIAAVGNVHVDGARREVAGDARILGEATFRPIDHRIDGDDEAWLVLHTMDPRALTSAPGPSPPAAGASGNALVIGAVAGAGVGALASLTVAGLLRWDPLRYALSPFAARLYSRIARDEVLDHRHREAILRAVREAPGVTPKELARASGLAWTTVAHHLRQLEAKGLVLLRRDGRRMRFYATEAAPADLHAAYAALRDPTSARFAELVAGSPGIAQKDAAEALGVSPSLLAWHATKLEAAGVLVKTKERGRARYHPGPAWMQVGRAAAKRA